MRGRGRDNKVSSPHLRLQKRVDKLPLVREYVRVYARKSQVVKVMKKVAFCNIASEESEVCLKGKACAQKVCLSVHFLGCTRF